MTRIQILGVCLVASWIAALPAAAQTAKVYWAETARVARANLDGSGVETIATTTQGANQDIELDVAGGKVYWTNSAPIGGGIMRVNLDGSGAVETFDPPGSSGVSGIGIDALNGHVYFTTSAQAQRMRRADLDPLGANVVDVFLFSNPDITSPWGIAVDHTTSPSKLYFPDFGAGPLKRSDLDGMNVGTLAGSTDGGRYVVVDAADDRVYWTASTQGELRRAQRDGSNVETVVTSLEGVSTGPGLDLDLAADEVYFARSGTSVSRRAKDGSGAITDVVTGLVNVVGVAVLPAATPVAAPALPLWGPALLVLAVASAGTARLGKMRRHGSLRGRPEDPVMRASPRPFRTRRS